MQKRSSVSRDSVVSLKEITPDLVRPVCRLTDTLTEPGKSAVTSNEVSLAQAEQNDKAWYRAIYADDALVGFIMIVDDDEAQRYFLWRLMIAEPYHGMGLGRKAVDLLVDYVRSRPGAKELLVSCVQGEGSPEGFYVKYGFKRNGQLRGEEIGLSLQLG